MHYKALPLFILLMYLGATECGPPRELKQKDPQLVNGKKDIGNVEQTNHGVPSTAAPESLPSPKDSNHSEEQKQESDGQQNQKVKSADLLTLGTQQQNCTPGKGLEENHYPHMGKNSSVEVSTDSSDEELQTQQPSSDQKPDSGEVHKQNSSTVQEKVPGRQQPDETSEKEKKNVSITIAITEYDTKQQQSSISTKVTTDGHEQVHHLNGANIHKSNTIKQYLPKSSPSKRYQATSLKDFHEDSQSDIKQQQEQTIQDLKSSKESVSSKILHSLEVIPLNEQKQQSSSVVLSEPVQLPQIPTEDYYSATTETPSETDQSDAAPQQPAQTSSSQQFVPSSNVNQGTNIPEYYDPDLYVRSHTADDLVTTNNALDPKPSVATYSGFTPSSFPSRTAIPQYAVREDHPDDLAPHHFAVNGRLPYALDRTQFIQYQQAARRLPYIVRVPSERRFTVPYPVLLDRKEQSFSLPLKVIVTQPVVVQAEDKVVYPANKPFSFRVQHGKAAASGNVQDEV